MIRFQKTWRKTLRKSDGPQPPRRSLNATLKIIETLKDCVDKYGFPICGYDIELKKYANGFENYKQTNDIWKNHDVNSWFQKKELLQSFLLLWWYNYQYIQHESNHILGLRSSIHSKYRGRGPIMSPKSDMLGSKYECNFGFGRVHIWLQSFLLGNKYECNNWNVPLDEIRREMRVRSSQRDFAVIFVP